MDKFHECPKCGGLVFLGSDKEHGDDWHAVCIVCGYNVGTWSKTEAEAWREWEERSQRDGEAVQMHDVR